MNNRLISAVLGITFVAFVTTPFVVNAQSADELRAQIAQILAQIYSLRAQLDPNAPVGVPQTPTNPVIPQIPGGVSIIPTGTSQNGLATFQYSRCPDLQFNLERGDRDDNVAVEVTMLQRFLSQDSRLYPEGDITGFFGPATERAVQRYQERHGIVARGDYQSTGYGRVGPRTRHAIKNSCGVAGTYSFAVSPVAGVAPLLSSATFEFRGSSCTSYQLDWGDGSPPLSQQAPSTQGACSQDTVRKQATHTYVNAGSYVVTLRVGQGSVFTLPIVGRADVTVQGVGSGTSSQSRLFLSNTEGGVPLTVQATLSSNTPSSCTSYELDWGDNSQPIRQDASLTGCVSLDAFTQQFTHTYNTPGIYTLRAKAGRGSLSNLSILDRRITVGNGGSTVTSTCFVDPATGSAPLQTRARVLLGGNLCDGTLTYRVEWGDGSVSDTRVCSDQNTHYEQLTHQYSNPGTYTARLQQSHPNARFEEQLCTVSVYGGGNTPGGTSCSSQYAPVCGVHPQYGRLTYTNLCLLQNGGASYVSNGECSGGGVTSGQDSLDYRIVNAGFRTVEFTALINSARECNGGVYTLYFGDGNDSLQPYPADACQLFTRTVTHSYSQNGTYDVLLLKNAIEVDRVRVTVSGSSSNIQKNLASVISAVEKFIQSIFK